MSSGKTPYRPGVPAPAVRVAGSGRAVGTPPPVVQPRRAGVPPPPLAVPRVAPPPVQAKLGVGPRPMHPTTLGGRSPAGAVVQPAAKPKKVSLRAFLAGEEAKAPSKAPAWGKGAPVIGGVAPQAPIVGPPTQFDATAALKAWDNAAITTLVGGAMPAKFYVDALKDGGLSGDGATQYWTFTALWVKTGVYSREGGACRLTGGAYVQGNLHLHFHPHAKPTSNYLHVKKSDGAAPTHGRMLNTHWLVKEIGLTAKDVTPDGT